MFGKSVRIFNLFGFPVKIDVSWLFIFVLITWTLAAGYFPREYGELRPSAYWIMAVAGALALFGSVLLHECGHALIARRHGVPVRGITLFIFGGVAEMEEEPPSARTEFLVAIGGPLVSLALALIGWAGLWFAAGTMPEAFEGVWRYFAIINSALLVFNMVPAFPLDGGRVLRSIIWGWKGNLRQATRIGSAIGGGFGLFLIGLGLLAIIGGNLIGGIWYGLIGFFLRAAAQQTYQQVLFRQSLQGEPVSRFMNDSPVTVPRDASIADLVDQYILKFHHKTYPVVDPEGRPVGVVRLQQVRGVETEERAHTTVGQIMGELAENNTIEASADAVDALSRMHRHRTGRLLVLDGPGNDRNLVGILSLRDLQKFLALKLELDDEPE